jgi:uncharacterized protein YecE (DUF72 family)
MSIKNYFLGCPIWANMDWVGKIYPKSAKRTELMKYYSQVFNSIEGNNTLYGMPEPNTVRQWREQSDENFRFCLKFPETISHQKKLVNVQVETAEFLHRASILGTKLGLLFLQLPPLFGSNYLNILEDFLAKLPTEYNYAIEVRHLDFFNNKSILDRFEEILKEYQINRVMFDTVVLHSQRDIELSIIKAKDKKPIVPEYFSVTGKHPFLRYIGHNEIGPNQKRFHDLAKIVSKWIDDGLEPYVFIHSPDKYFSPYLCEEFHYILQQYSSKDLGIIPKFPLEEINENQLSLF